MTSHLLVDMPIHDVTPLKVKRDLQRVSGIGPAFAKTLMDRGICGLLGLSQHLHLLNPVQQIGFKHVNDFECRIPRSEIEQLEAVVQAAARLHNPPLQVMVCGSYRRGNASSGDIDCLCVVCAMTVCTRSC